MCSWGSRFPPRTNCAIVSYENTLTINFASSIVEADVERIFFRKLISDGIHVKIERQPRNQGLNKFGGILYVILCELWGGT